ncbi:alpha/beta fold hydrolase [Pseudonocardia xinjiangensis]|uniref:alpha/beta fold hydrolase n=1 Tax=Pseudonocardia xinjiangensis TaxID=75289 RepID=UPI003D8C0D13
MGAATDVTLACDIYGSRDDRPPLVLLHGLAFDRRQWQPMLRHLAAIDPHRRVIVLDLPGHGESARLETYDLDSVVHAIHATVTGAGLSDPVVVGHSIGGLLATLYAVIYPAHGVVNLDQPLLPGPFGTLVREAEPVLRGPSYLDVWRRLLDGMRIDLLPADAQELVRAAPMPTADLLLGYWNEILANPDEDILTDRTRDLTVLDAAGVAYRYVASAEPPPAYRRWLTSALPRVAITVLPGGGHFPHLAHPAEVARLLTDKVEQGNGTRL